MIRFYSKRYVFVGIFIAIVIIGIAASFINGINLDIQFKGGSILKYDYSGQIDTEKVSGVVQSTLSRFANCQTTEDIATNATKLVISLAGNEGLSAQDQEKLDEALKAEFKDASLSLSETSIVEPFMGQQFFRRGITAVVLSFLLIVIYIWYRFRKVQGLSAGVCGIIALLHDVLVVFVAFIAFKIPLNESFIAAALTIAGYSINDTIVIFDRIRENTLLRTKNKMSTEELVDTSITQSLVRSINTSLSTLISIVIVYIFAMLYGISSIKNFALPLSFGIISGAYSSICIAGPIWVAWQNYKANKLAAAK
ncbi:MAG: protein translocase subunit SecF [Clostridia bacterium]|nr:protein translocase subunit SecF [Clostridia bacterium]